MPTLYERIRDFLTVYPKEDSMSDITPAPAAEPAVDPSPAPTAPAGPDLEARVAALESRVSSLESTARTATFSSSTSTTAPGTASLSTGDVSPFLGSVSAFNTEARYDELKAQGLSDADALEQAAYEERLFNDRHSAA